MAGRKVVKGTSACPAARSWLGAGRQTTARAVAAAPEMALSTVRNHSQRILEKLGVHRRAEAVERARRRGWI